MLRDSLRLSVVQNLKSIGNHLHIEINQKNVLRYVAPKTWRRQMSNMRLWTGFIVNQLSAHSHILINPKITNHVESKLTMWQDITKPKHEQEKLVETIPKPSKMVSKGSH